jgi:hypothetical protein
MATIRVTNQTELNAAVKAAKAGDTVVLAAGTYKELLVDDKISATAITFKSESATNPAVFGYARSIRSDGVVFQDLKVGRQMVVGVDQNYTNMALVQDSKNVSFKGVTFSSTGADAQFLGRGLFVRDSANVSVTSSDFSHLAVGMCVMTTTGVTVQKNKFHDLRIDGSEFTAVKNVLIDGNDFRDFRSSAIDHPDAIQFWTNGTKKASTDIMISNNVIMPGTGAGSQGIFIQDEVGGLPYERLTIKNNLLLDAGNYWNGIAVRGGKDVVLEGNTSISPTGDDKVFYIRIDNVAGVKLINNLSDQLVQTGTTGMTQSGNVFLKEQKTFAAKILGINSGTKATVSSLIVSGVGYQAAGAISSLGDVPVAKTVAAVPPTPTSLVADVTTQVAGLSTSTAADIAPPSTDFAALQPTSLASTLTPIATAPVASVVAAPVVTPAAATPVAVTPTVVAPALSASQQKAAAKAAAAAAKSQAKAAAAAAKAAAKAAKSNKSGTAIAMTPVVSQPLIPVAAAPIASLSTTSYVIPNYGTSFLTGAI